MFINVHIIESTCNSACISANNLCACRICQNAFDAFVKTERGKIVKSRQQIFRFEFNASFNCIVFVFLTKISSIFPPNKVHQKIKLIIWLNQKIMSCKESNLLWSVLNRGRCIAMVIRLPAAQSRSVKIEISRQGGSLTTFIVKGREWGKDPKSYFKLTQNRICMS